MFDSTLRVAGSAALAVLLGIVADPRLVAREPVRPNSQDVEAATSILSVAKTAYDSGELDTANTAYAKARDLARIQHDSLTEARGTYGLGMVALSRARYEDAEALLLDAKATFDRAGETHDIGNATYALGVVAVNSGRPADARVLLEKAIAIFTAVGDDRARNKAILIAASADDDVPRALARLQTLRRDAYESGDKAFEATVLHSWSDRLFGISEYDDAIDRLDESERLFGELRDQRNLATVYTSMGRLLRAHGQPKAALEYQLKALAINRTLDVPRAYIQSLNAVGVTYQSLGDLGRARSYLERAIAAAERTGSSSIVTFLRANLADILANAGDLEQGRALLLQTIDDAAPVYRALRNSQLAAIDNQLGRYAEARDAANRAMTACADLTSIGTCVDAYLARSGAERGLGLIDDALADSKEALSNIEALHRKLAPSDFLKQGFHSAWTAAYSNAIDLDVRRGDLSGAVEAAELARSRAFVDLLASKNLAERPLPDPADPLLLRGAQKSSSLRSAAVAAPPSVADLAAIAARLDSTILTYWVGRDEIFAWVIGRDGTVRGARTPVARSRLDALIRETTAFDAPAVPVRGAVPAGPSRNDAPIMLAMKTTTAWRELYDVLVKPVDRALPRKPGARLTIVPHGPLINLPFAALRDPAGRYLVERYTIHEVPSAAVLQFTTNRRVANPRKGSVLLVADPARPPKLSGERPLSRLPGASQEVHSIARLLRPGQATILAADAATERRVLDESPHKAVVHFATHAIVRESDPQSSFLALSILPGSGASGRLTSDQIYGLDLDADLVVLSACRSGGGVVTGDGIAGLARAFFYAGASSLIVSVWDVADESAQHLLPAFYRAWLAGATKASALRSAQLQLIRSLRAGRVTIATRAGSLILPDNPAFWAGFVLLGEPD